jgi:hypothetical protein
MTTCPNCGKWTYKEAALRRGSDGILRRFCTETPDTCFKAHEEALYLGDRTDSDSKIFDPYDNKAG